MSCSDLFWRVLAGAAGLLISVSACQPLPQPFAHAADSKNHVIEPRTEIGGIAVLPVTGAPEATSRALTDALAEALGNHDIPAAGGNGNMRSKFVHGVATIRPTAGDGVQVDVIWDVFDRNGTLLGTRQHGQVLPIEAWRGAERGAMRSLTRDVAAEIAAIIHARTGKTTTAPPLSLHVWPVEGAPEGDNAMLRRAMETALRQRDFAIASSLDGARLVVAGVLTLGPAEADQRPIEITWSVLDTEGQELGKLTQRNAVPVSALASDWPTLAAVIAENAAGGVSDLVGRLPPEALQGRPKNGN